MHRRGIRSFGSDDLQEEWSIKACKHVETRHLRGSFLAFRAGEPNCIPVDGPQVVVSKYLDDGKLAPLDITGRYDVRRTTSGSSRNVLVWCLNDLIDHAVRGMFVARMDL